MAAHETKACPRCGAPFECKSGNIAECQCYGLVISAEAAHFIALEYNDCLCRSCLQAIERGPHPAPAQERMKLLQSIQKFK